MPDRKLFSLNYLNNTHYSHYDLGSNEISIVEDEDDNRPPEYFFTSEYLTPLTDKEEIWAKGLFLLKLYNGAVNIDEVNHDWDSSVAFHRLMNWTTYEDLTPAEAHRILPLNPFPSSLVTDETEKEKCKQGRFIKYSIFLSKSEDDVRSLLLLAGNTLNFVTLYAIYDTLNFYLDKNWDEFVVECGYTKKLIKAFTATANNFGLLGINARHGEKGWGTPTDTLSLEKSKKMILCLTKRYIQLK